LGSNVLTFTVPGSIAITAQGPGTNVLTSMVPGSIAITAQGPGTNVLTSMVPGSIAITAQGPGTNVLTSPGPGTPEEISGLPRSLFKNFEGYFQVYPEFYNLIFFNHGHLFLDIG